MPIVFHNSTLTEIVFGTGLYGRGDPATHLATDVAYLHMFSAFGLFGLILFIAVYLLPVLQYRHVWDDPCYWAMVAMMTIIVIANFKETALFTRNMYTLQVIFSAWTAWEVRRRRASLRGTVNIHATHPLRCSPPVSQSYAR
jgi:hypothetical protein